MAKYIDTMADTVEGKFWLIHLAIEDGTLTNDNVCDCISSYFYGKYYNRIKKMLEYQKIKQYFKGGFNNVK